MNWEKTGQIGWVSAAGQPAQTSGGAETCLTVDIPDQPALFGILDQLRSLNLELVSLELVQPATNPGQNQ